VVSRGSRSPDTRSLHAAAAASHDHHDDEHHDNNASSAAAVAARAGRCFGTTQPEQLRDAGYAGGLPAAAAASAAVLSS
jgi:hypothetical protein